MTINNMDAQEYNIVLQKSVDKENVIVGDIITYNISIINEGDILIDDVTIIDTLVSELEFKYGSIVAGNMPLPNESVLSGVNIGCLKPGEIKTLTFKAKVLSRPCNGYIENSAIAKFSCDINLNNHLMAMDITSNVVQIKIDVAEIQIVKKANKQMASRGDSIIYEVELINTGTLQAKNILFRDILPKEVCLADNTFEVNGQPINNIGHDIEVYVGSIDPGECIVLTYVVVVNSSNCSGLLVNKATVTFNYNLQNGCFGEKTSTCGEAGVSEVHLGISTFKQISIDDNLCIPCEKPDIEEINDMKVDAEILECHVISTPTSISNEGQILSGYKLIVRGVLKEIIEYTSDTVEQSVHSAHYCVPFSSFIILPSTYVVGSKVDIEAIVEDIYYKQINSRCFFKNITLLINAKIMSC
ncbi:SPOCS domain-containing protein [Clostridium weizhouense]|uniref:DUF11 domain-containing protein n=1 Tax=Clostridium weizhouense TaxID=2859781 RepID=A0ABS7AKQ7_9CLOT|nr:SPOCS domain-containing protein [Clostridium weizhouense]MBW6409254.1 DUF11 domain-containing protein [Clostridium weizhouense]